MTAHVSGIVQTRCAEHPKAGDIDGVTRAVLAAMAYPVRDALSKCKDADKFICKESVPNIAKRSGFERKTVLRAQERAAELGLIECVKAVPRAAKHWRMKIIMGADWSLSGTSQVDKDWSLSGTSLVPQRDLSSTSEGPNPESSPVAQAEGDDDDREPADAGTSAGAAVPAAAPSTGPSPKPTLVDEVMGRMGLTESEAKSYISGRIAKSPRHVERPVPYIRTCMDEELQPASPASAKKTGASGAKSAKGAKPPAGVPTAAQLKGIKQRRRSSNLVPKDEVAEAVAASRNGEPNKQIADRLNVTVSAVEAWRLRADWSEAGAAMASGQHVEEVAKQFGLPVDGLLRTHERIMWPKVEAAVLTGDTTAAAVAQKFNVSLTFVERLVHEQRVRPDIATELRQGSPRELVAAKFNVGQELVRAVQREESQRQAHEQKVRVDVVNGLRRDEPTALLAKAFKVSAEFVEKVRKQIAEEDQRRAEQEKIRAADDQRRLDERRKAEQERQLGQAGNRKPW